MLAPSTFARFARAAAVLPLLAAFACSDPTGLAAPAAPLPRPDTLTAASADSAASAASIGAPDDATTSAPPTAVASADYFSGEFKYIQVTRGGTDITVTFQYLGAVTPAFTLGTGPEVFATQKASVPAKKLGPGWWTAKIGGLKSATPYWFRLDNLSSTWTGTARTLVRYLTVDIDSIRVISDGDWGPDCGDLHSATHVNASSWSIWIGYYHASTEYCVDSGETLHFPGHGDFAAGSTHLYHPDIQNNSVQYIGFRLLDADACGQISKGIVCGPIAQSYVATADVSQAGTKTYVVTTEREEPGYMSMNVNAVWYFRVKVVYKEL